MSRHLRDVLLRAGDVSVERWQPGHVSAVAAWLQPDAAWKQWDAPYLPGPTAPEREGWIAQLHADPWQRDPLSDQPMRLPICLAGAAVGSLSWHWEDPGSGWARVAIVLYDPDQWGRGHGTTALRLWVDWLTTHDGTHRVDLATWSGNERMLRAAARVGMTEDGRLRSARLVRGRRYDAVVMSLVRGPVEPDGFATVDR